jgi:DHA1 family bicyclomycin/chloramphenicol resistance-like MFS transporter
MARTLDAQAGAMELTISSYLIGFSLGQLLWGPIGDRFGRRGPIAAGLVLFVIGSAGCALSQSVEQVIAWRVVQAIGSCAGVVLARAMVRDLYQGARAAQMLSTLIALMAIGPLVGPILGGQILVFASWPAIFWTLAALGAVTLVALATLPETLPAERRSRETLASALAGYWMLLRQRSVIGHAMVGASFFVGFFAYIAGSPFAYIDFYQVPAQSYGLLFALAVLGVMASNTLNARLVTQLGIRRSMRLGGYCVAAASIALIVNATTGWGGLAGLVASLFVFVSMQGFIVANAMAGAMQPFPERAGAVSALMGALQYGAGIVGSTLLGLFADGTPRPMAWVMALAAAGVLAGIWGLHRAPANASREIS